MNSNSANNTPSRPTPSSRPNSNKKSTWASASASSSKTSSFARLKQDQQARNKDPDDIDYEESPSDDELSGRSYDVFGNESYTNVIIRREAVAVLDSPELLMMHAQARNDSIPQTRLHFIQLLSGQPPTPAQEKDAAERRLAQLKKLAKKRELADAGMIEKDPGSSSRSGAATAS